MLKLYDEMLETGEYNGLFFSPSAIEEIKEKLIGEPLLFGDRTMPLMGIVGYVTECGDGGQVLVREEGHSHMKAVDLATLRPRLDLSAEVNEGEVVAGTIQQLVFCLDKKEEGDRGYVIRVEE